MSIPEITPAEFIERRERGDILTLLDVREEWELQIAPVPGAIHIPMDQIIDRIGELDRSRETIILCRSGRRSLDVAKFLQQNGFQAVNLAGGVLAWSRDVDTSIPGY
ncbi:rhodanese-like domain-containing protein [Steroidobacter denitrificans]|uniref:rhodanese-like domain-containing protein n=1 Tax=Steroidobacter denitrificans TaxID=465721 RepID=UPI000831E7AE|nr:rhodanese-like domain-containing protein [Steroidobacter denitrificans]